MFKSTSHYYHRQGLVSLFLIVAFPLYFWMLILAFRDISWLTERTNGWDAIGVVSYATVYTFIESLIVFVLISLLGFLISKSWSIERRIALLSSLYLITTFWAMISQLYFLWEVQIPEPILQALVHNARPLLTIYIVSLILVAVTVVVPTYFVLRSDKLLKSIQDFTERITLLSMFYVFLSFVGLIIVIVRNI